MAVDIGIDLGTASVLVYVKGKGVVLTSGNHNSMLPPMALAPYCLPLFTYLLLSIRCLLDYHDLWIYDMLIGFTICFHICCFKCQIGNHQSDINQYPLLFSYWYIILFWVINLCIIAVAFFPKYNVYTSFWRYITAIFSNFTNTISFIFFQFFICIFNHFSLILICIIS